MREYFDFTIPITEMIKDGFSLIPLHPNSKKAKIKWQRLNYISKQDLYFLKKLKRKDNIAVMCGACSNNLVVIDCDKESNLFSLYSEGIIEPDQTRIVKTRRGHHIYFYADEPIASTEYKKDGYDIDIKAQGGYVIGEGSIVNDHFYSSNNKPVAKLPKKVKEFFNLQKADFKEIPSSTLRMFNYQLNKYKSRSHQEQAIITSLVKIGLSIYEIKEVFDRNALTDSHYLEHSNQLQYIRIGYTKAIRYIKEQEETRFSLMNEKLDIFRKFNSNLKYERDILLTLIDRAEQLQKLSFNISTRDIANICCTTAKTASKTLKELIKKNFITQTHSKDSYKPSNYIIHLDVIKEVLAKVTVSTNYIVRDCYLNSEKHLSSLKRNRFIKKNLPIFESVASITVEEFSKLANVNISTAYYQIKKMVDAGFIKREGKKYILAHNDFVSYVKSTGEIERYNKNLQKIRLQQAFYNLSYNFSY